MTLTNIRWKILALWYRHPFVIKGHTLYYCYACMGWGDDPYGYCCKICKGQGYS